MGSEKKGIDRADIAIRLTEERSRLGFSQRDFASKIGVSREGVRLYESGQREIGTSFLAQAATLGVDVQYVLLGVRSSNAQEAEIAVAPQVKVGVSSGNIAVVNGGTVHQVHTQHHVHKTIAEVKPGEEHIDDGQASALQMLVGDVFSLEQKLKAQPKTKAAIWASLNAHCGVPKYRLIKREDFTRAEKYLRQWIGRLSSMASAPVKDGDSWRKRKYAYIKINAKDDPTAVDKYIARNFKATSLTELSNDELEQVYRYVAGRKKK